MVKHSNSKRSPKGGSDNSDENDDSSAGSISTEKQKKKRSGNSDSGDDSKEQEKIKRKKEEVEKKKKKRNEEEEEEEKKKKKKKKKKRKAKDDDDDDVDDDDDNDDDNADDNDDDEEKRMEKGKEKKEEVEKEKTKKRKEKETKKKKKKKEEEYDDEEYVDNEADEDDEKEEVEKKKKKRKEKQELEDRTNNGTAGEEEPTSDIDFADEVKKGQRKQKSQRTGINGRLTSSGNNGEGGGETAKRAPSKREDTSSDEESKQSFGKATGRGDKPFPGVKTSAKTTASDKMDDSSSDDSNASISGGETKADRAPAGSSVYTANASPSKTPPSQPNYEGDSYSDGSEKTPPGNPVSTTDVSPSKGQATTSKCGTIGFADIYAYYTFQEKAPWMQQLVATNDLHTDIKRRLTNFRSSGTVSSNNKPTHHNCLKFNMLISAMHSYGFAWDTFADVVPLYIFNVLKNPHSSKGKAFSSWNHEQRTKGEYRMYPEDFKSDIQAKFQNCYAMNKEKFLTLSKLCDLHHLLYYHVFDKSLSNFETKNGHEVFCHTARNFFQSMEELFQSVPGLKPVTMDFEKKFVAGSASVLERVKQRDPGVGLKTPVYQAMQWVLYFCPYVLWNPENVKVIDDFPDTFGANTPTKVTSRARREKEKKDREEIWKKATTFGRKQKSKIQEEACTIGRDAYLGIPAFVASWTSGANGTRESLNSLFPKMSAMAKEYEGSLPALKARDKSDGNFLEYFQGRFNSHNKEDNLSNLKQREEQLTLYRDLVNRRLEIVKQREKLADATAKIDAEIAQLFDLNQEKRASTKKRKNPNGDTELVREPNKKTRGNSDSDS
jgi:hypothetical protein